MELRKIENNVGQWLFDALYHNEGSVEDIYEYVITAYNEEEDETKKEKLKDSIIATCKRLTVEDTMEEVKVALVVLLKRIEGKNVKLNKMENKLGCWLFNAVYESDVVLDEIIEIVLEKYNEEEDEVKKEKFKASVGTLHEWMINEPLVDELNYVLVELTKRL